MSKQTIEKLDEIISKLTYLISLFEQAMDEVEEE